MIKGVESDFGWLLSRLVRTYRHRTDGLLESLPGGARGYQVLILAQDAEALSQLDLAKYLGLDRTVMTYLLDELEEAGLVVRQPAPCDRRVRHVHVTAAGTEAIESAQCRLAAAEAELLSTLTPERQDLLRAILRELVVDNGGPCSASSS